jgi:hypothetical protein
MGFRGRARLGLRVGVVGPERTGLRPAETELGQSVKGAATDFVCWAESSHEPKREKEMKKRKIVSFYFFRIYFREENYLEIAS